MDTKLLALMGHKKNTRPQINILPLLVHSTHPNPHFTLLSVYLVLHTTFIFSCCVPNFLLVDRRRRRGNKHLLARACVSLCRVPQSVLVNCNSRMMIRANRGFKSIEGSEPTLSHLATVVFVLLRLLQSSPSSSSAV